MEYYLLAINIFAFLLYAADKAQAVRGGWRVPERYLLATVVAGGCIGAPIAMFLFRHKTRKPLFIFLPLVVIALYTFLFIRFAL
ncbi:MAG: DUF1294 domain-containing protein [Bacteroidaceae bacterium]|nr:DUF1294 domain-containing protein [Bacteroidaceae bacterium]